MQHLYKKQRILHWSHADEEIFLSVFLIFIFRCPCLMVRLEKKTKSKGFSVFRDIRNSLCDIYTKIQQEVLTGSLHLHPVQKMGQNITTGEQAEWNSLKNYHLEPPTLDNHVP